jgi:hypothetical protein
MNIWSRFTTFALAGIIVAITAGGIYYFTLKQQLHAAERRPALTVGGKFPAFSGVDVLGMKWEPGKDARCRVIRITEDSCPYCGKDKPEYAKILAAARRASCEVIEIAPRGNGMAYEPRSGVVQIKFVDTDVGGVLHPFITPQTVIVDGDWTVKANRRGIYDRRAVARSLAVLDAYAVQEISH